MAEYINYDEVNIWLSEYRSAKKGRKKEQLQNLIAIATMPLVKKIARTLARRSTDPIEDIIQVGSLGLIKAISEKVLTEQNAKVKNVYFNFDESSTKVDGKISRGGDLIVVAENGTVFTYRAVDVSTKKNVPLSEKVIACFTLGQFDMYVSGISNPNDYIVSSESEVELKGTMLNQAGTYVEVETDAPETTQETANAKNAERERTL